MEQPTDGILNGSDVGRVNGRLVEQIRNRWAVHRFPFRSLGTAATRVFV